jgi:Flp pilus assembly protein TadD
MPFPFLLRVRSRRLSLWIAAIFLAVICSAPSWAADPIQLNSRGVELIRQGQFEQAADLLEQAHRKLPSNGVVRENLAMSYLGLGTRQIEAKRYETAAETLRKGRKYAAEDARFWFYRGLALYQLGRHQEAESELNEARAMAENPETLQLLGQVYYASGRLEQAIEVWREALETGGGDEKLAALVNRT